jgi:hypothetical protein
VLCCAGKVASDLAGNRLFISDSSNNRIVVTDLSGRFLEHIGCGAAGLVDGGYEKAAFYRPQGVAYSPKVRRAVSAGRRQGQRGHQQAQVAAAAWQRPRHSSDSIQLA